MTQPTYTVIYYRNHVRYETQFSDLEDARAFLDEGSQDNWLAPEAILGPDGEKVPVFINDEP